MKNKYLFISGILVAALATGAYFTSRGLPSHNTSLVENAMHKYLSDKQGYQDNEYTLQVEYHWESALFGQDVYAIKVAFHDEQDVIYGYRYRKTEIYQNGERRKTGKRTSCSNMQRHNRARAA